MKHNLVVSTSSETKMLRIVSTVKLGNRSDNLYVNVATKYTSYIYIQSAAVGNCCCKTLLVIQ